MNRSRSLIWVGTLSAALAACAEEGPTTPSANAAPVRDLVLSAPVIVPEDLVVVTIAGGAAGGPFLSDDSSLDDGGGGGSEGEEDDGADIWDARTKVGFYSDHAYAEGSHRYSGQVGRVETTAHVDFENAYLGSQTAIMQEYDWLTFRLTHFVTAYAQVNTDHTCGLGVQGRSLHAAWGEVFQIKGSPSWGRTEQTTSAGPVRQVNCGRTISGNDPTGTYTTEGGIVCMYLITYDIDTREVLRVELLSCSTTDGDLI